jgi:hypothetical protein
MYSTDICCGLSKVFQDMQVLLLVTLYGPVYFVGHENTVIPRLTLPQTMLIRYNALFWEQLKKMKI